jgi:hypothetical protein
VAHGILDRYCGEKTTVVDYILWLGVGEGGLGLRIRGQNKKGWGFEWGLEERRLGKGGASNGLEELGWGFECAGGTEAPHGGQSKLRLGTGKLSTNLN